MSKEQGNKVLKSGIWYTISSISIRAIAIITTPIYTGMLSTGDYGIANTYNSWIEVFNIFTCLCIVYSIGRAKIDFKDRFDEYISCLQGLSSSFAFVVLIFAFIFRERLSAFMHYEVPLIIVLFVYLVISPSVEYVQQKCRYEYRYKENIIISVISCLGTVFFSVGLMLVFNDRRYVGKILGTIMTTFIMGIYFYIRTLKKGKKFYDREYWIYALKFGLPMIPHALALVVLAQIDRIMIKGMRSDAEAGLYTFGYSFATLLMIFTNAIGQAWLPWFNESLDKDNIEDIRKYQKKLVLLGIFLTLGFITVAPEALMLLSIKSPDYWQAKYVVVPVALSALAQYFYTNYVNVELFYKKTPIIAVSSIAAAVVNFVLNSLFIPRYGYIAAAYTTLASYLFLMLFHYVATRFVLGKKIYSDLYMFIAMFVAMALGMSMLILYDGGVGTIIARYVYALFILGVFAIVNRSDIIVLIAYIKEHYLHKEKKSS